MQICTAITASHLPWARVLATSFTEHHPGAPRPAVLVVDDVAGAVDGAAEPFTLLRPADVGLGAEELHRRGAMYGPMELAGSTRAALLGALLERAGGEPVAFVDADVLVCGPLTPVAEELRAAGIVFSPHLSGPPPQPVPLERALLLAGTYNCGFVGVAGEAGRRFARWWAGHLERDCINDPHGGLFVSQRWLDIAPSLFEVAMLRDPGTNVTTHNLGTRAIARDGAALTIDGEPLRLLHVGGDFDPRAGTWPKLSEQATMTELCRGYADRLLAAGHTVPAQPSYGFAVAEGGVVLEPWVRRCVRAALLAGTPAPDPFDADHAGAFTAWLAAPAEAEGLPVSRWALALRAWRPDLRAAFPAVPGADAPRYLRWLSEQDAIAIPELFRPPPVELADEVARRAYDARVAAALADARRHSEALAAELADVRQALDTLEDTAAGLRTTLTRVEAERDTARTALDALRSSRVLRLSRAPRLAWYRLRPRER